ncbi:carbohydrate kinase family protein [Chitinophaga lutea]
MSMEKKYDVIVVGELNVDLILNQLPEMPVTGREIFAGQMTLTLGSSAAILASNLSRFGVRVAFIGKTGADLFGDLIIGSLQQAGVDTTMIVRDPALQTGASIAMQHNEDRGVVTYAGAMQHFSLSDIPTPALQQARHLHFSSYFFQPAIQPDLRSLLATAKRLGLSTSFDMQTDPAQRWTIDYAGILPFVDIFFPNENEILQITRQQSVEEAVATISQFVPILALKLGSKGSLCVHQGQTVMRPAFPVTNVVDAIGAGDSFNAGFLYQYLKNAPIHICQEYGNIAGAISTMAPGGTSAFQENKSLDQYAREKFGYPGTFAT